jgi:hypothetical protein
MTSRTGYASVMSNRKDERPLELEDVPVEEGISGEDAAEQLAQSPEDKRNFTETHPEKARRERARTGDTTDDPAHSADEDEGWTSEGGATPSGPASDVGRDH